MYGRTRSAFGDGMDGTGWFRSESSWAPARPAQSRRGCRWRHTLWWWPIPEMPLKCFKRQQMQEARSTQQMRQLTPGSRDSRGRLNDAFFWCHVLLTCFKCEKILSLARRHSKTKKVLIRPNKPKLPGSGSFMLPSYRFDLAWQGASTGLFAKRRRLKANGSRFSCDNWVVE